ncbi:hypothetical protein D3C87_1206700 [compost metagenome]|uniref:hypothetical protein n=1 Tax=Pseudomonas fluorescens TaxID=294 RepID=UPI000F9356E6|nr:hypothetical protein [Pseudomonas fluorescens]
MSNESIDSITDDWNEALHAIILSDGEDKLKTKHVERAMKKAYDLLRGYTQPSKSSERDDGYIIGNEESEQASSGSTQGQKLTCPCGMADITFTVKKKT